MSVLTKIVSPVFINKGVLILAPVSMVTCLLPPSAVLPLIPGGDSITLKDILIGRLMLIG